MIERGSASSRRVCRDSRGRCACGSYKAQPHRVGNWAPIYAGERVSAALAPALAAASANRLASEGKARVASSDQW